MGYELNVKKIDDELSVLLLVTETAHKDFLDDLSKDKKTKIVAKNLFAVLKRIDRSFENAIKTRKLEIIDGNLCLCEIKNFAYTYRVFCYHHEESGRLVLLRLYKAHQGSDKIKPDVMIAVGKMAVAAGEIMSEWSDDDESRIR